MEPDFSGWATKAGLKCSDGRTIMPEAFQHMDGMQVPLVWQHGHADANNVLGHAILENRDGSMYAYGFFNPETKQGQNAKALVQHGDIKSLSIFANELTERSKQVFHGTIRELSLVLSGANPGALIDNVAIAHSNGSYTTLDSEAIIYTGLELEHGAMDEDEDEDDEDEELAHADGDRTVQHVYDEFSDEQKQVVHYLIGHAVEGGDSAVDDGGDVAHAGTDGGEGTTVQEVYDSLTDEQKDVVNYMIGAAIEAAGGDSVAQSGIDDDGNVISHQDNQEGLTHMNVFEGRGTKAAEKPTLSHDQLKTIVEDAQRMGSFKDSFLAHAGEYGIGNIDLLFPDAQAIDNTPELISRRQEWVQTVINGARKAPFSRIKSLSADITHEEARAKGYIKGSMKKTEWFELQKRETTPVTIYKKQKLDRDDIIEITDLDVVAWLKGEMRLMLDEEIARAVLVGDGREMDDDDKISETNIRPIARDSDFYTHRVVLPTNIMGGEQLVEAITRARPVYRGTGTPTLFTTEAFLVDLLLGRDKVGRRYYNSLEELRVALRVAAIVTVDVMNSVTTTGGELIAILVNMADYTMGSTRGGQVSLFDDFDIDYNQYKYLIEGRMSGALTKFKSAIAFSRAAGTLVNPTVPTFDTATGVLTVPNQAGVVYRDTATEVAFAAGAQPAVAKGTSVSVTAVPDDGAYFNANIVTEWTYTRSNA